MRRQFQSAFFLLFLVLPAILNARTRPLHLAVWEHMEFSDSTRRFRNRDLTVNGLSLCLFTGGADKLRGLGLALGGNSFNSRMAGLQLAGLGAAAGQVCGAQVSGLGNFAGRGLKGVQLAGLANVVEGPGSGMQASLLADVTDGGFKGIQLAGLASVVDGGSTGLQVAGLAAVADEGSVGIQAAGLASVVDGGFTGAQSAGLVSVVDGGFKGMQAAGLVNVTDGEAYGAQVAGLVNVAGSSLRGFQLGVFNVAEKVRGVQIGLVNVAEDMRGVPLGLVSYSGSWEPSREAWVDETGFANVGYRSGSRRFYNLIYMGQRPGETWRWTLGAGAGARFFLPWESCLETGVECSHLNEDEFWTDGVNLLGRIKAAWVQPIHGKISLAFGPSFNCLYSSKSNGDKIVPWSAYEHRGKRWLRLWPGMSAGLRF